MVRVAICAVASILLGAISSVLGWVSLAAGLHLGFAAGALPLIFAAMLHFVPVLTRTGRPATVVAKLPWGAMFLGWGLFFYFQSEYSLFVLGGLAISMFLLALGLLLWMIHRMRVCLGRPHVGVRWYLFSLLALLLGLLMAAYMGLGGGGYLAARNFHLHVNLLGFIGGAAFGTLPLLMPTALGRPDPFAAKWLYRILNLWFLSVLGIAVGAMNNSYWLGAQIGAGMLLFFVAILLVHWITTFRSHLPLPKHGAARALLVASLGFAGLLIVCLFLNRHQFELILVFILVFLFPLVSGALSQLLPVWCFPGGQADHRVKMSLVLSRWRGMSAFSSLMAGFLWFFEMEKLALVFFAVAVLLFISSLCRALIIAAPVLRSTR